MRNFTSKFVCDGADLMLPGVRGMSHESLKVGSLAAVKVLSHTHTQTLSFSRTHTRTQSLAHPSPLSRTQSLARPCSLFLSLALSLTPSLPLSVFLGWLAAVKVRLSRDSSICIPLKVGSMAFLKVLSLSLPLSLAHSSSLRRALSLSLLSHKYPKMGSLATVKVLSLSLSFSLS